MGFRLELLRGAQVLDAATGVEVPLRSYKGILAALGFAGRPLSREAVIAAVWPNVELSVGRNRLRVALAKFRTLMPGAMIETSAGLSLNAHEVVCDADEIRAALESCQDTVTADSERIALRTALEPVGDGSGFEAVAPFAGDFGVMLAQMLLRLSALESDGSNFEAARDWTLAATRVDPSSPKAWEAYLRASWRLGASLSDVADVRRRAPKAVLAEPRVREAMVRVQTKSPGNLERAANDRRVFMADILDAVSSRQDLMRTILSAPETLSLSGKQPRLMHDFLEQATPLDAEGKDGVWERAAARMIGLKAWLGDADGVIASAPALMEYSQDPAILRATWNSVAVAYSLVREWDAAFDALDKTLQYSREIGSEMYELATRGNGAFFKMQQGRYDEADQDYDAILARHTELDTPQSKFEYAIAVGNRALIPVFQGDWLRAHEDLDRAIETRSKAGLSLQMGIPQAALALARVKLGRTDHVPHLMRLSFLDAFQSDSFRSTQFTFELVAVLVSTLGERPFGRGLAAWVEAWRSETRAPRSAAEASLVARIESGEKVEVVSGEPTAVGRETMKRIRARMVRSTVVR